MDIMERLLDVAADRSGDGPSGPAYDPELLTVMSEAADEISRLRGTHAADDERLATAAQRVGIVAGCDAAEWMADEIERLRDENANLTYENDKLWAELRVCAAALPGPIYMDPPDGGSVTVAEQVARMAKDAARYCWFRDNFTEAQWAYETVSATCLLDLAIDAAMQKGE